MIAWAVTWRRKPIAQPFLIDVDEPGMAAEIAIRLSDMPRVYDVKITQLDPPPMEAEVKERILARIKERTNEEWALSVLAG